MPHVEASADIPVDADTLWEAVGSFRSVGDWHPMLAQVEVDGDGPGAIRTATTHDGSQQVERLHEIHTTEHFYRYTMEASPMPVRDYVAEFRVQSDTNGNSTIRWTADFETTSDDPASTVDMVQQFLTTGLDQLRRQYG